MKTIKLPKITGDSISVLRSVVMSAPNGSNVGDQRKRFRLIDQLDKAEAEELTLEDADYDQLKTIYGSYPFTSVHRDVVAIADAIDAAR